MIHLYGVPVQSPTSSPPFDAHAARRLREALGWATGHVAYGLQAQYGLRDTSADTVAAWERGLAVPTSRELTALAGVLWCSVGELLASASTLKEHRLARGLPAEDLARQVGLDPTSYVRMEESGRWRGNERQTVALAAALTLTPRELLTATGRDDELATALRSAATTRWQGYVRPVTKLLPMPREAVEAALARLHADYQSRMVPTLGWGGSASAGEEGEAFLTSILARFWERV